jgi:hypothetical protein
MTAQSRVAWLNTRRAAYVAALAVAEAAYLEGLAKLKRYKFVSADGSQEAERRDVAELKKQIDTLVSQIEAIDTRLHGGGVIGIVVARR